MFKHAYLSKKKYHYSLYTPFIIHVKAYSLYKVLLLDNYHQKYYYASKLLCFDNYNQESSLYLLFLDRTYTLCSSMRT
jgi:hypothetical protein